MTTIQEAFLENIDEPGLEQRLKSGNKNTTIQNHTHRPDKALPIFKFANDANFSYFHEAQIMYWSKAFLLS